MSDSSDDELYAAAQLTLLTTMLILKRRQQNKQKKRRLWAREWLRRREVGSGVLQMLNNELLVEDPAAFTNFLRMPSSLFEILLNAVENDITRENTFMRYSISARSRLQVTLRFLATGESFRSLMYSTRIHESTISRFIPEVSRAIYTNFKNIYLKVPNSVEEWEDIAALYYEKWDFPNCLGALDGRHIKFRAPRSAGSYYYNYKGDHSIVLLGLADANYKFTYVNVGVNGRISDGGVLRESSLSQAIDDNSLNFPNCKALPGRSEIVPYVIVADDAFPLSPRIMKPYSERGLTHDCRIFNYRLSRARRIIENAFGILANRFRILLNPIVLTPEKVELITLCCIVLHNFLVTENNVSYCDRSGDEAITNSLDKILRSSGNRNSSDARKIREEFKLFFSSTGARDWQEDRVVNNNM